MTLPKPCLAYGTPTAGSYCPAHKKRPDYGNTERARRQTFVDAYVKANGT